VVLMVEVGIRTKMFVCLLFVTMRPAGTQMYLRIILAQFYKFQ
jgi:hypothetical protein